MPNIPHNYSITFRAASLLGSQCCVLRYAAAPLTPVTRDSALSELSGWVEGSGGRKERADGAASPLGRGVVFTRV